MAVTFPGCQVFAFEPSHETFLLLSENAKLFPGINAFNFGLGSGEYLLPLHSNPYGSVGSSLGKSTYNFQASTEVVIHDAKNVFAKLRIAEADIFKIDTEGCEVPILNSLKDFLPQIKVIFIEYHSEDDRRWIDSMLAATHYLFSGKALGPHRGEFCFLRRDLAAEFDNMEIKAPSEML